MPLSMALLFERVALNKIAHIISALGVHQPSSATWCNLPLPKSFEEGSGENYIAKINGQSVLLGGTTASGEWVDVVVFENWLKWAIQTQVFNLMRRSAKPNSVQVENSIWCNLPIPDALALNSTGVNSTSGLAGRVRNATSSADVSTTVVDVTTDRAVIETADSAAGGANILYHYVLDARPTI